MTKGNPTNTPSIDDRELIERGKFVGASPHKGSPLMLELTDRLESLLSERDKLELQVQELLTRCP